MGCGSSVNSVEPKKTEQTKKEIKINEEKPPSQQLKTSKTIGEIDEIMGKKVPKV